MMVKVVFIIVALLLTGIAFLVTMDIPITGLICITYIGYFGYLLPKQLHKFSMTIERKRETYRFINAFVIALSVKKTPSAALDTIKGQLKPTLLQTIEQLDTADTYLILDHLKTYFASHSYEMFLTLLDLYIAQGGSILSISSLLLATLRIGESELEEQTVIAKRKFTNFVILWVLTLVVLLFSRFGISYLFDEMIDSPIFKMGMVAFFLFMLYSIYMWVLRYIKVANNV